MTMCHPSYLTVNQLSRRTDSLTSDLQTQSLKVTLCWMDPTNSIISAKLLLHDVDLIVRRTGGGGVWYGNKQPGDERNNVEQVVVQRLREGEG